MPPAAFFVQGGSIVGSDHLGSSETPKGRNNHDAFFWSKLSDGTLILMVCDGCGGSPDLMENAFNDYKHSEVGAKIGSRLLVSLISQQITESISLGNLELSHEDLLEAVRLIAIQRIAAVASIMTPMDSKISQTIRDFFLFTTVGAIISPQRTTIFSIGDGCYSLNGKFVQLGPFPGNIPPYLMYGYRGAVEYPLDHPLIKFQIHESIETLDLDTMLLGSDGVSDLEDLKEKKIPGQDQLVGSVSQFWENPGFVKMRFNITRRLTLLNGEVQTINDGKLVIEHRLLKDDTTLIVVGRNPTSVSKETE